MDAKSIGSKLKKLRGKKTQRQVANDLDITLLALTEYEEGRRIPRDEIKIKLVWYFDTTIENLFGEVQA